LQQNAAASGEKSPGKTAFQIVNTGSNNLFSLFESFRFRVDFFGRQGGFLREYTRILKNFNASWRKKSPEYER
jgi:hypothetical protein